MEPDSRRRFDRDNLGWLWVRQRWRQALPSTFPMLQCHLWNVETNGIWMHAGAILHKSREYGGETDEGACCSNRCKLSHLSPRPILVSWRGHRLVLGKQWTTMVRQLCRLHNRTNAVLFLLPFRHDVSCCSYCLCWLLHSPLLWPETRSTKRNWLWQRSNGWEQGGNHDEAQQARTYLFFLQNQRVARLMLDLHELVSGERLSHSSSVRLEAHVSCRLHPGLGSLSQKLSFVQDRVHC